MPESVGCGLGTPTGLVPRIEESNQPHNTQDAGNTYSGCKGQKSSGAFRRDSRGIYSHNSQTKAKKQPDPRRDAQPHLPEIVEGPQVNHTVREAVDSCSGDKEQLSVNAILGHRLLPRPEIR
jgi:hypothetical protein